MATQPKSFSDQIRDAVDASGLSRYAICNAIGISQSTMSRFMHHQGGLSMTSLDRLADLLGLSVTTRYKNKPEK
jgi:transcriptional regulator with XRE-family HTH domain